MTPDEIRAQVSGYSVGFLLNVWKSIVSGTVSGEAANIVPTVAGLCEGKSYSDMVRIVG